MLRLGSRTGYDIKQKIEISTRFFWGASYGQIYPELKRLAAAGLVEAEADREFMTQSRTRAVLFHPVVRAPPRVG